MLHYHPHVELDDITTYSVTKLVIKTKCNVESTWKKMVCVSKGQAARSLKHHLTWLMLRCFSSPTFHERFEQSSKNKNTEKNCIFFCIKCFIKQSSLYPYVMALVWDFVPCCQSVPGRKQVRKLSLDTQILVLLMS